MAQIGILSNYLKNKIINHLLRNTAFTPPAMTYVALYTVSPSDTREGTEVSGDGYSRQGVSYTISGNRAYNTNRITFPIATGDWGTIAAVGIMDSSTGGNLLFWGKMDNTITISTDENFMINPGLLSIELKGNIKGGWGDGVPEAMLKHILANTTFTSSGSSVYLSTGSAIAVDEDYTFVSWGETSGTGYSRKQVTSWYAPTTGSTCNLSDVTFSNPPIAVEWKAITHVVIFDAPNSGNALLWGKLRNPIYIIDGDGLKFSSGNIDISLD